MTKLLIAMSVNVFTVFTIYVGCAYLLNDSTSVRIIGGQPARDGQYPFQASLRDLTKDPQHFCGGSILNFYWIMTAGHCIHTRMDRPDRIVAVVGTNYLDKLGVPYNISEILLHDGFQKKHLTNDIAVLRIVGRIRYNIHVRPVALANIVVPEGTPCTLSGWGSIDSTSTDSNKLLYVTVTLINNTECSERKLDSVQLSSSNLCTFQHGKRACWGDSGGPLICRGQQYGIVSYGNSCLEVPDVHTSVVYYREWIRSKTEA